MSRIDELLGRRIDLRSMTLLRLFTGPIVVLHLLPFVNDARRGFIYRDTFHEPYATWYPELPRAAYVLVLCVGLLAGFGMLIKQIARPATVLAFTVVTYNLVLSTTHVHNNRLYLVIVLGMLAFVPGDVGPAWPLWLLRIEAATVYASSAGSKMLDRDWFGGTVTWGRMLQARDRLPDWSVGILTNRGFHSGAAKVVVLLELFIAIGLWSRRTRPAALAAAVVFHLTIAVTADVEVFSFLGLATLLVWAAPAGVAVGSDVDERLRSVDQA